MNKESSAGASVLVLGASGRIGGILSQFWPMQGLPPLWQWRGLSRRCQRGATMSWDILSEPAPDIGDVDIVLGMAGVVPGRAEALSFNTELALATLELAEKAGAKHVFVSSSAAVYGSQPGTYSETATPQPDTPYGRAKLAMEDAVTQAAFGMSVGVTCLRIGNVAGADALLGGSVMRWRREPRAAILLDQFPNGEGPWRSYIGPKDLADVFAHLCRLGAAGVRLPRILNVASPAPVAMSHLLDAANAGWTWRHAQKTAVSKLALDVAELGSIYQFKPDAAHPTRIVAQWEAMANVA